MSAEQRPLVVISHSREDGEWLEGMRTQLDVLAQYGHIEVWDDRQIAAGEDKFFALDEQLGRATIAICLISAHYLASPFIRKQEVNFLLERRQRDGLLLVPILVGPCVWQAVPWLKRLRLIPSDGKPVPTGSEQEVLAEAARFIWEYASKLSAGTAEAGLTVRGAGSREDFTEAANYAFDVVTTSKGASPAAPAPVAVDIKVDIQRLPVTGYKLFGRDKELELLDEAWDSDSTHVMALIAWGGAGKSTLVNNWLERLEADDYRGARRVYGWSFYSQGTKEQATSADYFFDEALRRWFGAKDFEHKSAWDKGELLAKLVKAEKTLLVLDGLEPLQSGSQFDRGTIMDPGLKTLLAELIRHNNGLCVVTSREELTDFADEGPSVSSLDLEHISPEAGRSLLRVGRVRGSDEELEQTTREFGGHALAVNLLAAYLYEIPGHDASERSRVPDLDIPDEKGRHPRRVIAALEELLGEGPELEILRLLGLFSRPALNEEIHAVVDDASIQGLTTHLHGLSAKVWNEVLGRLRELGLVARQSQHRGSDLDAHPLVREHFSEQLDQMPIGTREAHRRLYEYLKHSKPELPDSLLDMMPLFHAIEHGCAAGLHQEVYDEIYRKRIRRDEKDFIKRLGAAGVELAGMSAFFDKLWTQPTPNLKKQNRVWLLSSAGTGLRALGSLQEARQPMQAALALDVSREYWLGAAIGAKNLSELNMTLGEAAAAVRTAEQSVELADRSSHKFQPIANRTTLAAALHQSARSAEARAAFREAEAMHKTLRPEYPLLYSWWGFLYCDLLLDKPFLETVLVRYSKKPSRFRLKRAIKSCRQVRGRSMTTLEWVTSAKRPPLNLAVDHLTLGRTHLLESLLKAGPSGTISERSELELVSRHLEKGVTLLRCAEEQQELPRGLFARAMLARVRKRFDDALRDLSEAESIANRGSMLSFQIDAAIERCCLHLAMEDRDGARMGLDRAKQLIRQTEKPYESHIPDWSDWDPPTYVNIFKPGEIVGYHRRNPEIAILEEALAAGE